jgi:hypothetical protein
MSLSLPVSECVVRSGGRLATREPLEFNMFISYFYLNETSHMVG